MKNMQGRLTLAITVLFLFTAGARAATVYSNFDPGMTFDCCSGHGVGSQTETQTGFVFTPSASGFLNDIYVAASNASGAGEITFSLYNQVASEPGDVLEVFSLSQLPDFNTAFQAQHINAAGTTFLDSSQSYWLVASQPNIPDTSVWNYANTGGALVVLRDTQFDFWWVQEHERQFALQVGVSPVPLPPAALLFVSGCIGLLGAARSRDSGSE